MSKKSFKQEKGKVIATVPAGMNARIVIHEKTDSGFLDMFFEAAERMKEELNNNKSKW